MLPQGHTQESLHIAGISRKLHFEGFFCYKFRFGLAIFVGNYIFMDSAGVVFQLM
jgi:hypothetical protein